jgi:hypothetical protein
VEKTDFRKSVFCIPDSGGYIPTGKLDSDQERPFKDNGLISPSCALHLPCWVVFCSDLACKLARPKTKTACSTNGMVYQETTNLFECPEYCEANLIRSSQFSDNSVS